MMGSLSEEEDQLFDTRKYITSASDSVSDCPVNSNSESDASINSMPANIRLDVWFKNLSTISELRDKFLKWMGCVDQIAREGPSSMPCNEIEVETDRVMRKSGAVLGSSSFDDGFSSEFIVDELSQDGMLRGMQVVGSNHLLTVDEFERKLGLSPLVQKAMHREIKEVSNLGPERKRGKRGGFGN
ncbi:hypothetical protein PTKIN_Ptkin12aG0166000 [Pterospermum kingtungense]